MNNKTIIYTLNGTFRTVVLAAAVVFGCTARGTAEKLAKAPFTHGVNMTEWFEAWAPGIISLNRYDEEDIKNVKSLGVDVVRLPVHFDFLSSGAPDYVISDTTWKYLDKAVDWCENYQIYVVIDNHSFNGLPNEKYPSGKVINRQLQKVWPQIAARYKNRSSYVLYEILNEPQIASASEWNKIQRAALTAIRQYDTVHTVVVSGNEWSSAGALNHVARYDDDNLIYTFHCYWPMTFTHQGASWVKEQEQLSGIPFPYDKQRMPPVPQSVKGTWIETELKQNYQHTGTVQAVHDELMIAKKFSEKNHVPVWCGEMGVYDKTAPHEDRVRWYRTTADSLSELEIPFCVWGYGGAFGLFQKDSAEQYPYDLDADVVAAAGFTVPEKAGTPAPQGTDALVLPYVIFDDIPARGISAGSWNTGAGKTVFSAEADGTSSICMHNYRRYNAVSFRYKRPADYRPFSDARASLSVKMKTSHRGFNFDVWFVDPENEETMPWRMSYTVTEKDCPADGQWHTVMLPLASFTDSGAWSDTEKKWHPSENKFRWDCIDMIRFSAENGDMPYDVYISTVTIRKELGKWEIRKVSDK